MEADAPEHSTRDERWVRPRYIHYLSERSLLDRCLGRISIGRFRPFHDEVEALTHDPMGMFFYNQRAILFLITGIFILATLIYSVIVHGASTARLGGILLGIAWAVGFILTVLLHRRFRVRLQAWAASRRPVALPPLFDAYFAIDCSLIAALLYAGRRFNLPFDRLAYLLSANIIVYAAYKFIGRATKLNRTGLVVLFVAVLFLLPLRHPGRDWFAQLLTWVPVVATLLITLFSVTMMSSLAAVEHYVSRRQLELLGVYQNLFLGTIVGGKRTQDVLVNDDDFYWRLRMVLADLCSYPSVFWYRSAATWFVESHQDRGTVLLPGPYANLTDLPRGKGVALENDFRDADDVQILYSLATLSTEEIAQWPHHFDSAGPAALVPLRRTDGLAGVVLIYGGRHSPPVSREDEQFLRSLASITVNSRDQWRARFHASAQKDLDELFAKETLDDLFAAAVSVLRRYLFAGGCMIVFRPDPSETEMHVVAVEGFHRRILNERYVVGQGLTGKCVESGEPIRVDDVERHKRDFDGPLLDRLERAHRKQVTSWLAIPIGHGRRNYGVIKVVNRTVGPSWFTADDVALGKELALRLQTLIEKSLHIASMEDAKEEAQMSAAASLEAQAAAELTARERLQDLMTMTHQLQGPLIGVVGALSGISRDRLSVVDVDLMEHAKAIVEDAITVGFGIFTTFALAAGRATAFVDNEIDATAELRRLARRIRRTNPRPQLDFRFREEPGFPKLHLDHRVFTSVLYSLIHNALKYADDHTTVILECSVERKIGEPAIKVKSHGAQLFPSEVDHIFERFGRGRSVEGGQLYTGVGLGLWVARLLMRAVGGDLTVELTPDDPTLSVFVVRMAAGATIGSVSQ